jgi:hypothetical protein
MPYDYLWSEEEIATGNSSIIKKLLQQTKKAYQKESEFIQNLIKKQKFN